MPAFSPAMDSRLLPKKRFVVEIDRRDDAQLGHHHVRGVQPPAQPHFKHHRIHALVEKNQKRHGRHGFEVGGVPIHRAFIRQLLRALVYPLESIGELRR